MDAYGANHYKRNKDVVFESGRGIYLRDVEGREYIDAAAGYSSVNLGHNHPKICAAGRGLYTTTAAGWGVVNVVPNAFPTAAQAEFLEYSCQYLGADRGLPTNGGAEGIETAIKLMRKWGYSSKKGIPEDQAMIVVCDGNFHGRTTTIVGFSSEQKYRKDFGPYANNFRSIPFDDVDALERELSTNRYIVGFLVEPIQGEGGVLIPKTGYLKQCYDLCKKHNVIFCADEIQTGLGRTGTLLACMHENVIPDMFVLGKSLGAGRNAVAVVYAKDEYMCFEHHEHGSTYGGNAAAMTLALTALKIIKEEKLCENSAQQGAYLLDLLKRGLLTAKTKKLVHCIRGRGLMIGIGLMKNVSAEQMISALLDHGVMTKDAHHVIRITPPLIITRRECDELARRIIATFTDVASVS
jgi:ornithine--oxo-acid transaminase